MSIKTADISTNTTTTTTTTEKESLVQPPSATSETSVDVAEITLTDLQTLLANRVNQPQYNLSTSEMTWIKLFIISSPETFKTIATDIQNINSSGKIGVTDIPQIIKLFYSIYSSAEIYNGISNPNNIIAFIRFTLDVILDSNLIVLPDIEKEILEKTINICLDLLSIQLPNIEKKVESLYDNDCCMRFRSCFF